MTAQPPKARKQPVNTTWHGEVLTDDYAWLRQSNWQEMFQDTKLLESEIRAYLDAENTYTEENLLAPNRALLNVLLDELKAMELPVYDGPPKTDGPYQYFLRHTEAEYPQYIRRDDKGVETILVDINTEIPANGGKIFLSDIKHSPDHNYIGVLADFTGSEQFTLSIKNIATGVWQHRVVEKIKDSLYWSHDSKAIYYTGITDRPNDLHADRICRYDLATRENRIVFQRYDAERYIGLSLSTSGAYLLIMLSGFVADEMFALDWRDENAKAIQLCTKEMNVQFDADHDGKDFYFLTNHGGAMEFKIVRAPVDRFAPEHWQEIIPPQPYRLIEDMVCLPGKIAWATRADGKSSLHVFDHATGVSQTLPDHGIAGIRAQRHPDGQPNGILHVSLNSPIQPTRLVTLDTATMAVKQLWQQPVAHYNASDYICDYLTAKSHDGADVPMIAVRHKDTKLDGTAPVLLYGYGAYGIPMELSFPRTKRKIPLIDRGAIFVCAQLRGGKDKGYQWYLDGKLKNKPNSFHDFIACAQGLIAQQYTSAGKIIGMGGSAGGLLIGAVANMAPQGLFGGFVAQVPFLDVINTMTDASLPMTPPEWEQWGNPIDSAEDYKIMRSYSPYENIAVKDYPAMLITGGLTDPRVTYWEPAKYVARMRDRNTSNNPIYMLIEMDSGHGGDPGRFGYLAVVARELAFALQIWQKA